MKKPETFQLRAGNTVTDLGAVSSDEAYAAYRRVVDAQYALRRGGLTVELHSSRRVRGQTLVAEHLICC